MKQVPKLLCLTFALCATIAAPRLCHAQAKCPWLNAATAAGVLGGEVELSVSSDREPPPSPSMYPAADQRADRFDVTCVFRRKAGDNMYQLQITVNTLANPPIDFPAYLAQCPSKVALRAIGNEAFQCQPTAEEAPSRLLKEQVIARVRNRAFVLTIDRTPELAGQSTTSELSDETRNIAEQVAGSLF